MFGKLASLAKDAINDEKPPQQDQQAQQPSSGSSDQQWNAVGAEAKKAFEELQQDRSAGKTPDYKEIGSVAQKAFSAYKSEGGSGQPDLTKIGQGIVGGLLGKQAVAEAKPAEPAAPAAAPAAAAPVPAADLAPAAAPVSAEEGEESKPLGTTEELHHSSAPVRKTPQSGFGQETAQGVGQESRGNFGTTSVPEGVDGGKSAVL